MSRNVIIYRGPSQLTGDPIVVAITGFAVKSHNAKTGPMLQSWILRSDMSPTLAVDVGADSAICGSCALRSGGPLGRACYVIWWQAPMRVYQALPSYRDVKPGALALDLAGRHLRIGSYGDPAAAPFAVWERLVCEVAGWTGYTHQWRRCDQRFRSFLMASVDTIDEQLEAAAMGWRTFRVRREDDAVGPLEVICPASDEGGHRATCATCSLCQGASKKAKSVAILPHGQRTKWLPPDLSGIFGLEDLLVETPELEFEVHA